MLKKRRAPSEINCEIKGGNSRAAKRNVVERGEFFSPSTIAQWGVAELFLKWRLTKNSSKKQITTSAFSRVDDLRATLTMQFEKMQKGIGKMILLPRIMIRYVTSAQWDYLRSKSSKIGISISSTQNLSVPIINKIVESTLSRFINLRDNFKVRGGP